MTHDVRRAAQPPRRTTCRPASLSASWCCTSSASARSASAGRSRWSATCSATSSRTGAGSRKQDYERGPRARAARARAARRAARHLPRLAPRRRARRDAGRRRLRAAVVPDGARALRGSTSLRRAVVDAGRVLRHRRRRHRDHRAQRLQAHEEHARQDRLLWALFLVSALVTAWTESELVWLFVLSRRRRRSSREPAAPAGRCDGVAGRPCRGSSPACTDRPSAGRLWKIVLVLRRSRRVRVRQRPRDRAVPARRRRERAPAGSRSGSSSTPSRSR